MDALEEAYAQLLEVTGGTPRDGQLRVARYIADRTKYDRNLTVKAPTGTGKTMAALLGALMNVREGRRVVISTFTKRLMDQVVEDALPAFREIAAAEGVDIAVLKGAMNYHCKVAVKVHKRTCHGCDACREYSETGIMRMPSGFHRTHCWSEPLCEEAGKKPLCRYTRARARAQVADIVITNHAMAATALKLGRATNGRISILGSVGVFVFDECHRVADALFKRRSTVSVVDISKLLEDVQSKADAPRSVIDALDRIAHEMAVVRQPNREYREAAYDESISGGVLRSIIDLDMEWLCAAYPVTEATYAEDSSDMRRIIDTMAVWRETAWHWAYGGVVPATAAGQAFSNGNYRIVTAEVFPSQFTLEAVSQCNAVFMSATPGAKTGDPALKALGWEVWGVHGQGLDGGYYAEVPSPFDYPSQLDLRTEAMPLRPEAVRGVMDEHGDGRSTIIITDTHRKKNRIADDLEMSGWYDVYRQADSGPGASEKTNEQVAAFREAPRGAVMVGVDVLGLGADFPGEQCEFVIVTGIPSPVSRGGFTAQWRRDYLLAQGRDPAGEYVWPWQAMDVVQRVGRAVRTVSDRASAWVYGASGEVASSLRAEYR